MFYDVFTQLCQKRGISDTTAIQAMHLSTGNLKNWKNGRTPKTEVLKKVADYFDVSVDYLLGKTEDQNPKTDKITKEDIKFALFDGENVTEEMFNDVLDFVEFIKNKYKKDDHH